MPIVPVTVYEAEQDGENVRIQKANRDTVFDEDVEQPEVLDTLTEFQARQLRDSLNEKLEEETAGEDYRIDGEQVPVEQVDGFDGGLILSTGVTAAVKQGFDFANIWRHKSVTVENDEETFTATVVACEIEHGMAAIRLTEIVRDPADNSTGGSRE